MILVIHIILVGRFRFIHSIDSYSTRLELEWKSIYLKEDITFIILQSVLIWMRVELSWVKLLLLFIIFVWLNPLRLVNNILFVFLSLWILLSFWLNYEFFLTAFIWSLFIFNSLLFLNGVWLFVLVCLYSRRTFLRFLKGSLEVVFKIYSVIISFWK